MSQCRPTSRKKKVFLINSAHDYRTVIFGKTNFRWFATRDLLARWQHSICCKSRSSVAAARSTQTAAIHFRKPRTLSGLSILRYYYKFVRKSQDIFSFFLAGTRAFEAFRAHSPPVAARIKNLQGLPSLISRRRLTLSRGILKFAQKCSRSPLHTDCGISTSANPERFRGC